MTTTPQLLRQGSQWRGENFTIGFIGSIMRTSDEGGGIAAKLGIADAAGRVSVALGTGESAPLPHGGTVRVIDIFVSPDGSETAAALDIAPGNDPTGSPATDT